MGVLACLNLPFLSIEKVVLSYWQNIFLVRKLII
jgi:hypothetical protein